MPQEVRLYFRDREYEAISVCAGPTYTLILGRLNEAHEKAISNSKSAANYQKEIVFNNQSNTNLLQIIEKFRKKLRRRLLKDGSLFGLFDCVDAEENPAYKAKEKKDKNMDFYR